MFDRLKDHGLKIEAFQVPACEKGGALLGSFGVCGGHQDRPREDQQG